ncbi:MAG: hypothetical protein H0V70_02865 [Ktedonobacteraceae bacterium]|nr:hypothetical protein [Ktedonobacteraceae bacterium]
MANKINTTEKILAQIKGLRNHLQPDEEPLLTLPGIWDGGQEKRSTACDIILTNQRLLGYYFVSFPRERIFLDALTLTKIRNMVVREKKFEPLFRELLVSEGQRKLYIRAPKQKIETLYTELRSAIETYAPMSKTSVEENVEEVVGDSGDEQVQTTSPTAPAYGRQEINTSFESSNIAIVLLFMGGLTLEIGGASLWATVGQAIGLPLCIAGFVLVFAAIVQRRQRR